MSAIEDIRQVLQDFIAPELRAITTRLDAIEQQFRLRLDAVDQRFDGLIALTNARFESISREIAQVRDLLEIDRRLTKLESKQSSVAQ